MKILMCVWGNYKIWKKVQYKYNNTVINSNTTLPLLYKEIKPEHCVIILGDTLIDNMLKDGWVVPTETQWYNELCEKIKFGAEKFIIDTLQVSNISFDGKNLKDKSFPKVLVIPAVGNFEHVQCMGHPFNFSSVLFYHVLVLFQDLIHNENLLDGDVEIYLDITHGINYMTISTYSLIREICSMLSFFCNASLIVLNSDPVPGIMSQTTSNSEVKINEVEKVKCQPHFNVLQYPVNKYVVPSPFLNDDEKRNVISNLKIEGFGKDIEQYYAFAAAVQAGALLYIYKFYPEIEKIKSKLNEIFTKFNESIHILTDENNKKTIIKQQLTLLPIIRELLKILLCAISLEVKYGIKPSNEITVKECRELISFYEKQKILKVRITRELDRIEEAVKSAKSSYGTDTSMNYIKYVDLVGVKPKKQIEERDFFAHSGFAYDSTYLRWDGENIFLKIDNNHLEDIKKKLYDNVPAGI